MSQVSQGEPGDEQAGGRDEITWVGAQHLMQGYCGRASEVPAAAAAGQSAGEAPPTLESRPIAVVRTRLRQTRVVRIGPPRATPRQPQESPTSVDAA
jgi:hypothetical protein